MLTDCPGEEDGKTAQQRRGEATVVAEAGAGARRELLPVNVMRRGRGFQHPAWFGGRGAVGAGGGGGSRSLAETGHGSTALAGLRIMLVRYLLKG